MSVGWGRTPTYPVPPEMSLIPWENVRQPNGRRPSPLDAIASVGRQALCSVRQAYPPLFQNPLFELTPPGRFVQQANDEFWNFLCEDIPIPANQGQTPFVGGQCPTFYRIVGRWKVVNSAPQNGFTLVPFVQGPIEQAYKRTDPLPDGRVNVGVQYTPAGQASQFVGAIVGPSESIEYFDFSLERTDGQPDTCGDRPLVRQSIQNFNSTINAPIRIGGQVTNQPITINNFEGDGNEYNWTPSVTLGDMTFRPTVEGLQLFPNPNFTFAPEVNLDVGAGSVPGAIANILEILPGALDLLTEILDLIEGGGGGECDLEPLANYIRCLIEKPNASIESLTLVADSASGIYPIDSRCVGVIVNRNPPLQPGTKIQSGTGNNPNVEFWGWASFGSSGNFTERTPLNYQNTFLVPVPGANQVLINPTFGNTFSAVQLIEVNSCVFTP